MHYHKKPSFKPGKLSPQEIATRRSRKESAFSLVRQYSDDLARLGFRLISSFDQNNLHWKIFNAAEVRVLDYWPATQSAHFLVTKIQCEFPIDKIVDAVVAGRPPIGATLGKANERRRDPYKATMQQVMASPLPNITKSGRKALRLKMLTEIKNDSDLLMASHHDQSPSAEANRRAHRQKIAEYNRIYEQ